MVKVLLFIPKRQACISSAETSSEFLLLIKSVIWFFHDCRGLLLLLLLPCGVRWLSFFGRL